MHGVVDISWISPVPARISDFSGNRQLSAILEGLQASF